MTRAAIAFSVLACAVLSSGRAAAQRDPDARQIAEARRAFERGVARMRQERWADAEAELVRSLNLHPTQVAAFNLGVCAKEQGRVEDAIAIFERFQVEFGDEASAERRAEVERELEVLRATPGSVRISVDVEGAEILVDGRAVGTSPLPDAIELPGGEHDFEARKSGYASARNRSAVRPRAETEIELELGEPEPVAVEETGPSGIRPIFFWSAAGIVALGTIATTVFGVLALQADSDYQDAAVRTREDRDGGKLLVGLADASLIVTVFAGVFAGVFYTQTDWSEGMFRLGVAPGSITLAGSFR